MTGWQWSPTRTSLSDVGLLLAGPLLFHPGALQRSRVGGGPLRRRRHLPSGLPLSAGAGARRLLPTGARAGAGAGCLLPAAPRPPVARFLGGPPGARRDPAVDQHKDDRHQEKVQAQHVTPGLVSPHEHEMLTKGMTENQPTHHFIQPLVPLAELVAKIMQPAPYTHPPWHQDTGVQSRRGRVK